MEGRGPTVESPHLSPQKTTFEKKKKWEKLNAKPRDMGSYDGGRGDPRPGLRRERRPVALHPCSGVLLEGALTSGMCVGEDGGGQAAPGGCVCASGAGRG